LGCMAYGIPYSMHQQDYYASASLYFPSFSPGVPTHLQLVLIKRRHVLPQEGSEGHRGAGFWFCLRLFREEYRIILQRLSLPPKLPAGIRSQVSVESLWLNWCMAWYSIFHLATRLLCICTPHFLQFSQVSLCTFS
jgi:hypothetical protein